MTTRPLLVGIAVSCALLACGDDEKKKADTDTGADTSDTADTADTAEDTAPDTAPDTTPDTVEDTTPDTTPDTVEDTTPDTVEDTTADSDTIGEGTTLRAFLSGAQEVPAVDTTASGSATVVIDAARSEIAVTLTVAGDGPFTAAHIHLGEVGVNGGVMFPIASGAITSPVELTLTADDIANGMTLEDALAAIESGGTYVNVHSAAFPGGEMRGQLGAVTVNGTLSGLQEADAVDSAGGGTVSATFNAAQDELTVDLAVTGLTGVTAAHLHAAPIGINGGVYLGLTAPTEGSSSTTFKESEATDPPWSEIVSKVLGGELYANVHTTANPGGELRAHLGKAFLRASLSGGQEVPRVTSVASGSVTLLVNGAQTGGTITVTLTALTDGTAMHIHGAADNGENAGVWLALGSAPLGASTEVDFLFSDITAVTPAVSIPSLLGGHTYVNVHTTANPGGEIRGQLGPTRLVAVLSGAQEAPAPIVSDAVGSGKAYIDGAQAMVRFELDAGTLADITAAHVHTGLPGVPGGVIVGLASASFTSPLTVTTVLADLDPLVGDGLVDALLSGTTYFNVHTTPNPGGEIRGQIGMVQLAAALDAAQEVPTNASTRTGTGSVVINGAHDNVRATLALSSDDDVISAHIHGPAPRGENAGVLFGIASGTMTSPITLDFGVAAVTGGTAGDFEAAVDALVSGLCYFNAHTNAFSGGEIRGQIEPPE